MRTCHTFYDHCFECRSQKLFFDELRGEIICENCGLVVKERVQSHGPEWRAYNIEEENLRSRVSLPYYNSEKPVLKTVLGRTNHDSYGKRLNSTAQAKYGRLSQINGQIEDQNSCKIKRVVRELKRIKSHLVLSNDSYKMALHLYCLALDKNMIRGRSLIGMISAATYLACRKKKVPITLKDLAGVADISTKKLGHCIRVFLQYININDIYQDPVILISRLGEQLGLTMYTRKIAIGLLEKAKEKKLTTGKAPMTQAASIIYIATVQTGERRTQQQISNSARVSPLTIRNNVRHIVDVLKIPNFKIKPGAGSKAVIIKDPKNWVRKLQLNQRKEST